ncbi:MAG: alpha/beta fold hydrolase [Oligoflexus sp.]
MLTSKLSYLLLPFCIFFLLSPPLTAVPEEELVARFPEIREFFASGVDGFFPSNQDMKVHYRYFVHPQEKMKIVVLPGRTESIFKYEELAFDFYQRGYSVYLIDWPGQGFSGRYIKDPHRGHVTDYVEYRRALELYINLILETHANTAGPEQERPNLVAMAHSMGANILSLYLIDYPKQFHRAILSSPMLDIPTPIPPRLAWFILRIIEALGFEEAYLFGHRPFQKDEENRVTSSKIRRERELNWRIANPQATIGGVTMSWARASLEATWQMRRDAERLTTPTLMLQAHQDEIVNVAGQDYVCEHAPNCRKLEFSDARHEILQETDRIRDRAMKAIFEFLEND